MITSAFPVSRRPLSRRLFLAAIAASVPASAQSSKLPHVAIVESSESLTPDTRRIRFRLPDGDPYRFTAGQFVLLQVPDEFLREWNGRYQTAHTRIARPYSFASSPKQLPNFDLIVKLAGAPRGKDVPPGVASSYIHSLKPGDSVRFSDPMGVMRASPDGGHPVILAAGGTGAAPFLSFLQSWFEDDRPRNNHIYFYFGARSLRDLFLHQQFQAWAKARTDFTYVPVLSNPEEQDRWQGETGYVNSALDRYAAMPAEAEAYIAGPPVMLREVQKVLLSKGIKEDRIHHDPITVQ
jgi:Na+-transporting NADH:ubiquinone oxidoreductase subunit F